MKTLNIPAHEYGKIRVFAVNRAAAEISKRLAHEKSHAVAEDLLGRKVPGSSVELFAVADLTGVGLSGYLLDGYAVNEGEIYRDRAKLEALDGYVLLVFSSAFDGNDTQLEVGPELNHIGTYGEATPEMAAAPIQAESAKLHTGAPVETPPPATPEKSRGPLVVLGLIVFVALGLWWLLT